MSAPLRLGTRRSALATAQATLVADRLRALGHDVELVPLSTQGDESPADLTTIGGTGVFAAAIRRALLSGQVDLAVHSLKDLPVAPEPCLVVAAVPPREDPRDVLVARDGLTLGELPAGATVGTGSPRRQAQVAALGLGLSLVPVRGNVDTRIALVDSGRYDGVLLARAGLARLGRLDRATEVLDPIQVLPAPGQGALAVECRTDRPDLAEALGALDDLDTRCCVTAERALLRALEAGCTAPVGALAEVAEGPDGGIELSLRAFIGTTDGASTLRRSLVVTLAGLAGPVTDVAGTSSAVAQAASAGERLAAMLIEDGAADLGLQVAGPQRPDNHAPDDPVPEHPRRASLAHRPGRTTTSDMTSHPTEQVS